jgi:hypothetical protein
MNWILLALGIILGAVIVLYFLEFGRELLAKMRDANLE